MCLCPIAVLSVPLQCSVIMCTFLAVHGFPSFHILHSFSIFSSQRLSQKCKTVKNKRILVHWSKKFKNVKNIRLLKISVLSFVIEAV